MFILFQLQFSDVSEVDGSPFQFVESDHTTGKINQASLLLVMSCNSQLRFLQSREQRG